MTLNYGIFDSADPASPDRTYTATLLSRILSKYLSNGVVSGDLNELKVSVTDPPAMTVVVATGTAIVQGRFIENDAALTLNVSAAHATYPRIDRVVVRLSAVTARTVDIAVKAGTAASSPVAPELTQTTDVYEIPLAQIAVGAGVTSILTANITDQRVMPDITNLFRHDVEMGSSLNIEQGLSSAGLDVYGDSVMYGDLEVSGSLSAPSGTFTGNFVGPLTGSATQFGGKTPEQHVAALKCAIVSSAASIDYFTHTFGGGNTVNFPAPLKSNTTVLAYGSDSSNTLFAILANGSKTIIAAWSGAGTSSSGVVPAGAIGLYGTTSVYVNLNITLTI
ncbi:MAG: hypothetical protein M0P37_09805 [Synergistaceae bacterium]|nr:hypothetical protein [Synergistaceae bacterium]